MTRAPRRLPVLLALIVALLVAASGGAVAAKLITGKDIADGTVTGADIKNKSLTARDLDKSVKQSLQGEDGADGVDGTDGVDGAGLEDFGFYQAVATAVPANTNDFVVEGDCPTGQSIIGAWAYWATDNSALQVSVGFIDNTTMAAVAYSTGIPTQQNATIQFSCATIPLPPPSQRRMLDLERR